MHDGVPGWYNGDTAVGGKERALHFCCILVAFSAGAWATATRPFPSRVTYMEGAPGGTFPSCVATLQQSSAHSYRWLQASPRCGIRRAMRCDARNSGGATRGVHWSPCRRLCSTVHSWRLGISWAGISHLCCTFWASRNLHLHYHFHGMGDESWQQPGARAPAPAPAPVQLRPHANILFISPVSVRTHKYFMCNQPSHCSPPFAAAAPDDLPPAQQ